MVVEIMLLALMKCMIWSQQFMDIFEHSEHTFAADSSELDKSDKILMFFIKGFSPACRLICTHAMVLPVAPRHLLIYLRRKEIKSETEGIGKQR